MKTVSVLCVAQNSFYKSLPGVDCYDFRRDARTFAGGTPVVAHPPCRAWSAFCSHQAKPAEGEKELGLWCCEQLRRWGGVLEHPAHSRLFAAAELPLPGETRAHLWTVQVSQAWWGYPLRKATWLCFSGISKNLVNMPFRLHARGNDRRREQCMSKNQRSQTMPAFAVWLVELARKADVRQFSAIPD